MDTYSFHTSDMLNLLENTMFADTDDSTLLAVIDKPVERLAVAA